MRGMNGRSNHGDCIVWGHTNPFPFLVTHGSVAQVPLVRSDPRVITRCSKLTCDRSTCNIQEITHCTIRSIHPYPNVFKKTMGLAWETRLKKRNRFAASPMARHDPPNNPPEPVSNESGDVSPKVLFERAQLHDRPGVL